MISVKICGVTRPEDAVVAAECGAWAIGLIFAPGSPRRVSSETARRVTRALPKGVLRVGVFLDQRADEVARLREEAELDLVQLHGAETNLYLRALDPKRCIKSVFLRGAESLPRALEYEAEYLLLDRPRAVPDAAAASVDWDLARALAERRAKVLLAGGLLPETVGAAIRRVRPWGVDVSSGLERAPGIKDSARIREFFSALREAEAAPEEPA